MKRNKVPGEYFACIGHQVCVYNCVHICVLRGETETIGSEVCGYLCKHARICQSDAIG